MLEIEFLTKRVSWIFNISKIKKTAATGSLYIERPSYVENVCIYKKIQYIHELGKLEGWTYKLPL